MSKTILNKLVWYFELIRVHNLYKCIWKNFVTLINELQIVDVIDISNDNAVIIKFIGNDYL